jgi:hypothetical protein
MILADGGVDGPAIDDADEAQDDDDETEDTEEGRNIVGCCALEYCTLEDDQHNAKDHCEGSWFPTSCESG